MMDTSDPLNEPVRCDLCGGDTSVPGYGQQLGVLHARWGYGARHDGERYRVRLCEGCFFQVLAYIKQERRIQHLFNDEPLDDQDFGLVARGDYWGDVRD
ncbi:hypothetical protein SOH16_006429 [Pseudomonas aeruginosa]|nr:hypothetical protein [Pseudomonas aeruginosa]ELY8031539.1 hypothetical protein [Pseudomonas aeruginosa]RTV62073.1 hypothetical protein DY990_34190 [Pseudomonas aeruginosa]